jgi:hypothetical protein
MTVRAHFPPEFEAKRGVLEDRIAKDFTVQEVLAVLKQADVSSNAGGSNAPRATLPKRVLPFWYYRKTITRFLRRFVPQHHDPTAP